jgi:pSer/pThr/pTyr-binding forkhead associated (FHA) protein
MGKDADEACCDTCRMFGDTATPLRASPEGIKLIVTRGRTEMEHVPVGPRIVIGRGRDCDLVLDGGELSRKQCMIELRDGEVVVTDLQSGCGTYVDHSQIQTATLRVDSIVQFGNYRLRVVPR